MKNFNDKYKPDYNGFFSMINHIADELNERKLRFDKADLIEMALAEATEQKLSWEDDIGFDLQDRISKDRFEVKSQKFCLITRSGGSKKKTSKIKLNNTLQQSDTKQLKNTADWLILVDTGNPKSYSIAIISYSEVTKKYAFEMKDGFGCQIPISELTFLVTPEDVTVDKITAGSYRKQKSELQKEIVSAFLKQKRGKHNENSINQGIKTQTSGRHPIICKRNRGNNRAGRIFRVWNSVCPSKKKWPNRFG